MDESKGYMDESRQYWAHCQACERVGKEPITREQWHTKWVADIEAVRKDTTCWDCNGTGYKGVPWAKTKCKACSGTGNADHSDYFREVLP